LNKASGCQVGNRNCAGVPLRRARENPTHAFICLIAWIVNGVMRQRLKLAKSDLSPERASAFGMQDAQYLGRDSRHLTTFDQPDRLQLEFQCVPSPWFYLLISKSSRSRSRSRSKVCGAQIKQKNKQKNRGNVPT
jgi:hypothetical protein